MLVADFTITNITNKCKTLSSINVLEQVYSRNMFLAETDTHIKNIQNNAIVQTVFKTRHKKLNIKNITSYHWNDNKVTRRCGWTALHTNIAQVHM